MSPGARQAVREASMWGLIAVAGLALFLYYDAIAARVAGTPVVEEPGASREQPRAAPVRGGERTVRLRADGRGHFAVEAHVNDRPVALLADTGATLVTLTYEDARRLGLAPTAADFTHRTQTANGVAMVAPVTLDRVRIGDIMVRNVQAVVAEPGRLPVNLLGMSFIGALTRVEMQGGELVLVQ